MFYGGGQADGWVRVSSGKPNGRSTFDVLDTGSVRIKGQSPNGKSIERIVHFYDGQVFKNIFKENGRIVHHIEYGKFERSMSDKGREIIRFHKNTGKGLHGKSKRYQTFLNQNGICHSWYKNGRLVRQKFIYDNKRIAYDFSLFSKSFTVKDHHGKLLYEIKGALDGCQNLYGGGTCVLDRKMSLWFSHAVPFEVKKAGKVIYKGQYENRQKVGEWIEEDGKDYCYQNGLAIPKDLYFTPPEKLNPRKILAIQNAQLRMALCVKIGNERIAKLGEVIHSDGDMRLLKIKGLPTHILRVKCPSTKQFYYLNVPLDSKKCEEARQWTFGVGDSLRKPIKFTKET